MRADDEEIRRITAVYGGRHKNRALEQRYDPANPAYEFMVTGRREFFRRLMNERGIRLGDQKILEVGCGRGRVVQDLVRLGADPRKIHGVDLMRSSIEEASRKIPGAGFACAAGQSLPYKSASFGLVMQYTVFSSVLSRDMQKKMAAEMVRVLDKTRGLIVSYDFWINPFNRSTRGVGPGDIRRLFPGCSYEFHKITLAPPITRLIAPRAAAACRFLEKLKIFNTHYLVLIRPE